MNDEAEQALKNMEDTFRAITFVAKGMENAPLSDTCNALGICIEWMGLYMDDLESALRGDAE